ncbi:MAG: SIMPL domain-containing protein [Thermoflexus sp.]|uniref:SIMPL domain-containing protein n=1 Tax=Thermoflexus sp. TaxID=1969742 RepID=UPI0025E4780F|nr:SIMPL domain-containing protein [Thermoflexus sp.]MCS6965017.1 SIMPL domain-containing protein [Thermoflexus sp.]MDW8186369.1 SIMPL domain-containing protein [Anaerolineae bacterium]
MKGSHGLIGWGAMIGLLLISACRPTTAPSGAGAPMASDIRAAAFTASGGASTGLTVMGVGTTRARPDQAVVTLGVETESETLAMALRENNQRASAVLAALKEHGVAEADIQTASFQIQIEEPRDPQTGRRIGPPIYHVVHVYTVIFRDLDRVGPGVDAAVAAGANRVDAIAFQIGNPDRLVMEARRLAAEDAKARAQTLASALGAQLGRIVSITEITSPQPVPMARSAAFAEAAAVPVAAGELEITVQIQVTWELR